MAFDSAGDFDTAAPAVHSYLVRSKSNAQRESDTAARAHLRGPATL